MAVLQSSQAGGGSARTGSRNTSQSKSTKDPTKQFLKAAGQSGNSSAGGSQILSSGGDPLSGSMSVNPRSNKVNLATANRLVSSAIKTSPNPNQVTRNVKTVLGGNAETSNPPADRDPERTIITRTIQAAPTDMSGVSDALSQLTAMIAGQQQNQEGGGLGKLPLLILGGIVLFFVGREL